MAEILSGSNLRAWREAQGRSISWAANFFSVSQREIVAWENGEEPVDRFVALHVLANPPNIASPVFTIGGAQLPSDAPQRVRYAQTLMQAYINHMEVFDEIFGADAPISFCVSFWNEGAKAVPRLYFGTNGLSPCPDAERACWSAINNAEQNNLLLRTVAKLNDCPADVRAYLSRVEAPQEDAQVPAAQDVTGGDFLPDADPARAVGTLAASLHRLIMERRVPFENLHNIWSGMLYALSLNYSERPDIMQWITCQPYLLGDGQYYATYLSPAYQQVVSGPAPSALPAGARGVVFAP